MKALNIRVTYASLIQVSPKSFFASHHLEYSPPANTIIHLKADGLDRYNSRVCIEEIGAPIRYLCKGGQNGLSIKMALKLMNCLAINDLVSIFWLFIH